MPFYLIPIIGFYLLFQAPQSDTVIPLDDLIRVNSINDRVLLVTMGYDAVAAVTTSKGTVVIDAGISPALTRKYREAMEDHLDGKPIAYLINTHGHPDHAGGNQVFAEATIVGQENCPAEYEQNFIDPGKKIPALQKVVDEYSSDMEALVPGDEEWTDAYCQKLRYQSALDDFETCASFTRWDLSFRDSLHLELGELSMDLRYFGKAHSRSDILVYIPEMKLLFSGDLFFPYGRPSFNFPVDTNCQGGIDFLKEMLPQIETIIGGHGQVMEKEDLQAFIRRCEEEIRKAE